MIHRFRSWSSRLEIAGCAAFVFLGGACRDGISTTSAAAPKSSLSADSGRSPRSSSTATSSPSAATTASTSTSSGSTNASTALRSEASDGATTAATDARDATKTDASASASDPTTPQSDPKPAAPKSKSEPLAKYGYEVVHSFPHDPEAFTQGFLFENGMFYESTGLFGSSSIRRVIPQVGQILNRTDFPEKVFGEGLTLFDGKLYMLTWKTERGIVCDPTSLQQLTQFAYTGEGWGLTHDATSLIMSDGSSVLRFIDPKTFAIQRTIEVKQEGKPIDQLNELEYVKGEIYSNVWKSDTILRIDPKDGRVAAVIDLAGLHPLKPDEDIDNVLNGIAYDAAGDRLFVTGKRWPKVFEIKLVKK
jgi:glutaminyl-peptide cyclotransferase